MALLEGKKGLVLNIANDRSIAWHIANNAIKQGATCGFGYLPIGKMERRVQGAMSEGGFGNAWLRPCDVSKDEDIETFFSAARVSVNTARSFAISASVVFSRSIRWTATYARVP